MAKELSDADVVFESETEAVRRVAEAIAAPEGHDLEADPDLGRGLRSAVKEAYRTAIASFRESIAGTDLGHELELEASIDISRQLRDLERRLEGREYYDVFPGDEEGLDTAAGLVANRQLEYVERDELEEQPESERMLVVGRKGVGKSRALAEMLTRVEPGEVEHVVLPRDPLTQSEQLGPLEREHFDGDVLLVWDDVHEESNHVFTEAVRRLDDVLSEQGDDLWVMAAARSEADDEIPGRYGDPEGFWEEYGFNELKLGLLAGESLEEIFEEALAVYEVEADEKTKEAFVNRAMEVDPSPFYVETVVRSAEERITEQEVKKLPDSALEIWENQYQSLYPNHKEAQFILRATKLLDAMDVPLYQPLVRGFYENVFDPGREHFSIAIQKLERKHWIVGIRDEDAERPAKYMLHDLQLEAIDQPLVEKAQEISEFLTGELLTTIPDVSEEVNRFVNGHFGIAMKELGGGYLKFTEKHWCHIIDNIDHNDAIAHYNLGILRMEQGQTDDAAEHFETAVEINPDHADAHSNLGALLAEQGHADDAAGHFEAAIDADPQHADAHFNLGVLREKQGNTDAAASHFEAAIDAHSDYADAHYRLGALREEEGRLNDAVEHFDATIDVDPDNADAHFSLGVLRERQGRFEEAIGHFEDALDVSPDFADAHYNLGVLRHEQDRLDAAIERFEAAINADPSHADAHFNLGVLREGQGRIDDAIKHYEIVTDVKPNRADAHFNLGFLLHEQDHIEDAAERYETAIHVGFDQADVYYNLGVLRHEQGRLDEAIEHFEAAVDADTDHADAHFKLGILHHGRGSVGEAFEYLETAIDIAPDHASAHYFLGLVLHEQEDLSEAKGHVETALDLVLEEPDFHRGVDAFSTLVDICLELDDPQTAHEYHDRVRTAMEDADEPIDDDFWELLEELADRLPDED